MVCAIRQFHNQGAKFGLGVGVSGRNHDIRHDLGMNGLLM